jgi:hypothetical protein
MGLKPKTQRCLCHMKYGESLMLEAKRVPGRIPFVRFDQESLRCLPLVTMMQATDLRQFNYPSQRWWLDRARNRSVFCQGQMSARSFVIVEIQLQNATQTAFIEDEDVVETVTPDRAD